jgi:hypothetical protein
MNNMTYVTPGFICDYLQDPDLSRIRHEHLCIEKYASDSHGTSW